MLVPDGHESHVDAEFDEYCKANNIVPHCLPPHSSDLDQPLDVGVFGPLKKACGAETSVLARANVIHVTEDDFFPAFRAAFTALFTTQTIKGGFRGAGLVPFDPAAVSSKLDIKLRTPTPSGTSEDLPQPWVPQRPHTAAEALSQSTIIKDRKLDTKELPNVDFGFRRPFGEGCSYEYTPAKAFDRRDQSAPRS